ncbi:MAG: hypothetical protein MUE80_04460, partial [Acidobacteria bacterium]|nr:hypothetical protein [Acidobacteriota bacterium]
MNKTLIALALAVLSFAWLGPLAGPALAQSGPPASPGDLEARVSAIVGRFPGETAAATTVLAAELVALGPGGLARTLALVLPPGEGNDAKARFAVNGLAVHVTRAGAESERRMFAGALLSALATSGDKTVAAFFMTQLQRCGRVETVKPLARYLADKDLAAPAAAVLQTIGGPEASRLLLKSLDAAPLPAKLSIVDALGALRSREAVKKILALTDGPDEGLRRAARSALANIGDPSAGPALAKVRVAASWNERAEAPGLYLLYARRLKEAGRYAEALEAARSVLAAYGRTDESQTGAEALTLIVSLLGKEAVPDLIKAVDGPSPALRAVALRLAVSGPLMDIVVGPDGVDRDQTMPVGLWIEKAKTASPEIRAAIVSVLGKDIRGQSYVRECLNDPDKSVRLAAIQTPAPRGGRPADLFPLLAGADAEEAAALKAALLQFRADEVVPYAARLIDTTPHPGKAALIGLLAEKGARAEFGRVFALAVDPDPATRAAATAALAALSGEGDLRQPPERGRRRGPVEPRAGPAGRRPGRAPESRRPGPQGRRPARPPQGRRREGPERGPGRNGERRRPGPDGRRLRPLAVARLWGGRGPSAHRRDDREQALPPDGRRGLRPARRPGEHDRRP